MNADEWEARCRVATHHPVPWQAVATVIADLDRLRAEVLRLSAGAGEHDNEIIGLRETIDRLRAELAEARLLRGQELHEEQDVPPFGL
jgi:hypothetical protein